MKLDIVWQYGLGSQGREGGKGKKKKGKNRLRRESSFRSRQHNGEAKKKKGKKHCSTLQQPYYQKKSRREKKRKKKKKTRIFSFLLQIDCSHSPRQRERRKKRGGKGFCSKLKKQSWGEEWGGAGDKGEEREEGERERRMTFQD